MNIENDKETQDSVNVASLLSLAAERTPYKRAVVSPEGTDPCGRITYSHLTFSQLDEDSSLVANGLTLAGITRGTRTILMVTPSIEFFVLTFALFKAGAVPVVVDPGMGIKRMLSCLEKGKAEAFVGIPKAHVLRLLRPSYFRSVKHWVTVGKKWCWGGHTLDDLKEMGQPGFVPVKTRADETAAILFTTGSTGPAKGVVYTHGTFAAQVSTIKSHFAIGENEVDLPTFPLFALFDPALGMTAVIPDMDPTKPAKVNPEKIIEAVRNQGVTNMFASPALLNRVGAFGKENAVSLPSLRRVVSAGAPVSPANIAQFSTMLDSEAEIMTPYGATEAVPIVSMGSREILSETRKLSEQGFGMCVGRPIQGMDVRLIRISDDPVKEWSDDLSVSDGEIGEITVVGDLVTESYFEDPEADAGAKIRHGERIRHRMGDLGWMDSKGRIWFCGRKGHRVITEKETLYTIPCEAIFNNHPKVFRSALVGVGPGEKKSPVICIEPVPDVTEEDLDTLREELMTTAGENVATETIGHLLFHKSFPVDIRHNSKIFREKLAVWAEEQFDFDEID